MRTYLASLKSMTPYFQSRNYEMDERRGEKIAKESAGDFEKRTWRLRCHINEDGQIVIPPSAFQFSLQEAAKYLGEKIPGERNATWTKHFLSGLLVPDPIVLPERRETVKGTWLFLNADGKRGGGTRVWKCLPTVPAWAGDLRLAVLDEKITSEVLLRVLQHAGAFKGIGQNRPEKGGNSGRFVVEDIVMV